MTSALLYWFAEATSRRSTDEPVMHILDVRTRDKKIRRALCGRQLAIEATETERRRIPACVACFSKNPPRQGE